MSPVSGESATSGFGAGGELASELAGGGIANPSADEGESSAGSVAGRGGQSGIATYGSAGGSGGGKLADAGSAGDETHDNEGTLLDTPSCSGLLPTGCEKASPCLSLPVPGGRFHLGRDETGERGDYFPNGGTNETPEHEITVSPFFLDKYEVTVGRFRRFVDSYQGVLPNEDAGASPHIPGSGWRTNWNSKLPADAKTLRARLSEFDNSDITDLSTWNAASGSGECRPVNYLDWYLAFAFCVWDGGRLPTEAEWEFVAAGGDEERLFPWGNAAPTTRAVFNCSFSGGLSCTSGDLPHVGSLSPRGNGRFGHADLAGSLGEFTRDVFEGSYDGIMPSTTDPVSLNIDALASEGALRGGYFSSPGDLVRGTVRRTWDRELRSVYAGVRCARDL